MGRKKKSKPAAVHSESLNCPTLRQEPCVKGADGQTETHNPQTQQQIMQVPDCIAPHMQKGTDHKNMGHSNCSFAIRAQIFWFVLFVT